MKALTQDQLAKVETNLDKYFELATQEDIIYAHKLSPESVRLFTDE